jgi:hypothetical protein
VVFKDDLDHECEELPPADRLIVAVLTVAAPCVPSLTPDRRAFLHEKTLDELREKIRLVYRMAAHNGHSRLVLGACFLS